MTLVAAVDYILNKTIKKPKFYNNLLFYVDVVAGNS